MADANWLALDSRLTLNYKNCIKMLTLSLLPNLICYTIRKTSLSQTLTQRFLLRLALTRETSVIDSKK